jgi:hypothetical protein
VPQELKPRKLSVRKWKSSGVRGITDSNDIFSLADPAPREALQTLIALYLRNLIIEISHKTITLPKPKTYATTDRKFINSRFAEKPTTIFLLAPVYRLKIFLH